MYLGVDFASFKHFNGKKKKEKSIALFPKSTEDKGSQNTHRMLVRNSSTSRLMYELCCGRI